MDFLEHMARETRTETYAVASRQSKMNLHLWVLTMVVIGILGLLVGFAI